jgi:hypothetical protein
MTTPAAGAEQNAVVPGEESFTNFAKAIAQAAPSIREKLAQKLKEAGLYKGKVSSEFNNRLYDGLLRAEQKRITLANFRDVSDRFAFIDELVAEREAEGGAGEGPQVVTSRTISKPEEFFDEIDTATRSELGRELSTKAKKKLANKFITAQKAGEFDVTTVYGQDGAFRQTTGGGMAPTQFFIEEISQTDEAKANKALRGYEILDDLFGGLR